jgi:hypothetical protein
VYSEVLIKDVGVIIERKEYVYYRYEALRMEKSDEVIGHFPFIIFSTITSHTF